MHIIESAKRLVKYSWLLQVLVERDLKIRYRRSFLGYLWSVLNPLMMMVILTIVFSNMFRFDIPQYPVYLLAGQLIFGFFAESTSMAMSSILGGAALIKKVYLPKYIFPLSRVLSSFTSMLLSMIALFIVIMATDVTFSATLVLLPWILCLVLGFCIGVGLLLSVLVVFFRDVQYLYSIFLTAFNYLTPIFYPETLLPDWLRELLVFNPLYNYIKFFRKIAVYGEWPSLPEHLTCIAFTIGMLIVGLYIFKRKQFNLATERVDSLKDLIIKKLKFQSVSFDEFWALRNISFSVDKGESCALIGANGSGKSTMLKIISGILTPTKGSVEVNGSIAPLIELGAGFDPELTGRENIFLNGAILGYSKKLMMEKYDEIIDFSELRDFIDVPVKNYSSGMIARLGFSIATIVKPDILVVDEILAVGDQAFQDKCHKRLEYMMNNGTTVLLVSHSAPDIKRICQKAVWIDRSNLRFVGDVDEALSLYNDT